MATQAGPIQVMLHHGLGDVLMAVPMLKRLREARPDSALDVIVRDQGIANFGAEALPWPEARWHVLERTRRGALRLALELRRQRPAAFLGVHAKSRNVGLLARITGAPIRVGPSRGSGYTHGVISGTRPFHRHSVYDETRHKCFLYADFLRPLGIAVDNLPSPSIGVPSATAATIRLRFPWLADGRAIGIAPGCGLGPHKQWPASRFAAVITELAARETERQFVILGATADRPLAEAIVNLIAPGRTRDRVRDLTGQTSPLEALGVMAQLASLITVCNGSSHLAAASGIPIIGLYGPTNPGFTGAYSADLHVVRLDYACSPCYRTAFNQGCGEPRCMLNLGPGSVVQATEAALAGNRPKPVPRLANTLAVAYQPQPPRTESTE